MVTVYTLKSAGDASKYYAKENYYSKDANPLEYSKWAGRGAKELGVKGQIPEQAFKQLLEGKMPSGQQLGRIESGGKINHRPGYDLTFSMCKSASIMALVAKDDRILKQHEAAVLKTIDYVEKNFSMIRKRNSNGGFDLSADAKLVFANYMHTLSRERDPQVHTHAIALNMLQDNQGKWRCLYGDDFYDKQLLMGVIYRTEFASNLQKLGYELNKTNSRGCYEINGVSNDTIKLFSKRRADIEEIIKQWGNNSAEAKSAANFLSRKDKQDLSYGDTHKSWVAETNQHAQNINELEQLVTHAKERGPVTLNSPTVDAIKAINLAIESLSSTESVFTTEQIKQRALELASPGITLENVTNVFSKVVTIGETLIALDKDHFTIPATMAAEKQIVELMQQGKRQCMPIMRADKLAIKLASQNLTNGQYKALELMLNGDCRYMAINGRSGSGKTTMLRNANNLLKSSGYRVIALAPTTSAAKELANKAGIKESYTAAYFLKYIKHNEDKILPKGRFNFLLGDKAKKTFFIVDESSMVNNQAALSLLKLVSSRGSRACFVGDLEQQQSLATGKPIVELIAQGMSCSTMPEIVRQSGNPSYLNAINSLYSKNVNKAFELLRENTFVATDKTTRIKELTDAFLKLAPEERNHALIVVIANSDKLLINKAVREQYIRDGVLTGSEVANQILIDKKLDPAFKKSIHQYHPGNVVRFGCDIKSLNIKSDTYYKVISSDLNAKIVHLGNGEQQIAWRPEKHGSKLQQIQLFETEKCRLMRGDIIRWTYKQKDVKNKNHKITDETAKVLEVSDNFTRVELENGSKITLDNSQYQNQHFEHGYAITSYAAQGKDAKHVFALLESYKINGLNFRNILVAISRGKESCKIFTDDVTKLAIQARKFTDKTSTLGYSHIENSNNSIVLNKLNDKLKNYDLIPLKQAQRIEQGVSVVQQFASDAVNYACQKITETNAAFSLDAIRAEALQYSATKCAVTDINLAIKNAINAKEIIKGNNSNICNWTTKAQLQIEQNIIEHSDSKRNSVLAIVNKESPELKNIANHPTLTKGQKAAITMITTSKHRINLVQGVPGSGKTTMLVQLKPILERNGYTIVGASCNATAKQRLQTATGINSFTVAKLLQGSKHEAHNILAQHKKTVLIVDEASTLSNKDMLQLLNITAKHNVKVILVGDVKQRGAVQSGKPFHLLMHNKVPCAFMNEMVRFKDHNAIKAVQNVYVGRINQAFSKIDSNIFEIKNSNARIYTIAKHYSELDPAKRSQAVIITATNAEKEFINHRVRNNLLKNNILLQNETHGQALTPKNISLAAREQASSYSIGDVIRFNNAIGEYKVNAGSYGQIITVDAVNNATQMILLDSNKEIYWHPARHAANKPGNIEIYSKQNITLSSGDIIRWRRNNETNNIRNGETATVLKVNKFIEQNNLTVQLADNSKITIDLNKESNQHFEYGYATTVDSIQGLEPKIVLANIAGNNISRLTDKRSQNPNNINALAVIISRSENTTLYVNNKQQYIDTVQKLPSSNRSAMEMMNNNITNSTIINKTNILTSKYDNLSVKDAVLSAAEILHTNQAKASLFDIVSLADASLTNKADLADIAIEVRAQIAAGNIIEDIDKNLKPAIIFENGSDTIKRHKFDRSELEQSLRNNIKDNISLMFGAKPTEIKKNQGLWGNDQHLKVILSGKNIGAWEDRINGISNDNLVSLHMHLHGIIDWKEAYQDLLYRMVLRESDKTFNNNLAKQTEPKREQIAWKTYSKAISINNPKAKLAKDYFKSRALSNIPQGLKFAPEQYHPNTKETVPAIIAPIKNVDDKVTGVLRLYLDKDGNGKYHTTSKMNQGVVKNSAVIVNNSNSSTVMIAEGLETAMSIAAANPEHKVLASLSISNMANAPITSNNTAVVLCADNDGSNTNGMKSIIKAVSAYLERDRAVFIVGPQTIAGKEKTDFNDVLQLQGKTAVRQQLDNMVQITNTKQLNERQPLMQQLTHIKQEQYITEQQLQNTQKRETQQDLQRELVR